MTPEEKLRRAFDNIYDRFPFLASIVAQWNKVPTTRLPTAATNGPTLYYNPTFLDTLNIAETTDLILHEAGHNFLGHHLRMVDRHPRGWNVGADLALNDHVMKHLDHSGMIRKSGCFPGEGGFATLPKGKDAEFYYDAVMKNAKEQQQGQQGKQGQQGQGKGSDGSQSGQSGSAGSGGSQGSQQGSQQGSGGGQGKEKSEEEGAGGGGKNDPLNGYDDPQNDMGLPQSVGDVLPHPGLDGADEAKMEELKQEWEQQVAQGINAAKSCGSLPGWLEELANNLYNKESRIDWETLLRRFLTKHAPTKFSYDRPSRRHSYRRDVILPARHGRSAAPGAVVVDTSGSMSEPEMNAVFTEISAILSAYTRCEVTMFQCDTRLNTESQKFTRWDFPLNKPQTWKGRGGTDLSPAIKEVAKSQEFAWILVLSDMYWNYQQVPNPGKPVMWLTTRAPQAGMPKFGEVVPVKIDKIDYGN